MDFPGLIEDDWEKILFKEFQKQNIFSDYFKTKISKII